MIEKALTRETRESHMMEKAPSCQILKVLKKYIAEGGPLENGGPDLVRLYIVKTSTMNLTKKMMGSQCNSLNKGVT